MTILRSADVGAALRARARGVPIRRQRGFFTMPGGLGAAARGGGGGGATAYQYWRVYITDNDGDGTYTSMSELKLLDSGASDFIAGLLDGDCSESSANSSDGAHRLTDGDTGSEWVTAAGQSLPSWVSFQIAVAKVLVSYKIRSQRVVTGRNPTEWEVQGSNTHPTTGPWTTVHAVTGETGWGVLEERTFTV